jgi:hypothetical protein
LGRKKNRGKVSVAIETCWSANWGKKRKDTPTKFCKLFLEKQTDSRGPALRPLDGKSAKLEPVRPTWKGEKPKPSYNSARRRWGQYLSSRAKIVLALLVFVVTAITLFILLFRRGEPEHDLVKATKEYHDYLASPDHQALIYPEEEDRARGKAAIIALVRNSELRDMAQSMRELEETFNRKFKYPWIFFNDEPFEDKFKRITSSLTDAETFYGNEYPFN